MKVATWNVNSLKVRLQQVLDWLASSQVDVLGLQETKLVDEAFPAQAIEEAGYDVAFAGQKTYNGVALLTRRDTIGAAPTDVITDLPLLDDPQRRVLVGTCGGVRVANLYVPNGQSVESDKYQYKLGWLDALRRFVEDELTRHPQLVVMGDFNIAPDDRDVHDPEEWEGKVLCSPPERERLAALKDLGLSDTYRLFDQPEKGFSWWDYRAAGFRRNRGLRIDLILSSEALTNRCQACRIDVEPRTWERPSDHTPVVAEFADTV